MISLKQVHTEDFNRIYPLFAGFNYPRLSNKDWFCIFQDNWQTNTGYIGYMLLDDDNVVGFFGLIFSKHIIGGQVHLVIGLSRKTIGQTQFRCFYHCCV